MKKHNLFWVLVLFFAIGGLLLQGNIVYATGNYAPIDYSERAKNYRVNMKGIPNYGDCAIASIASVEAYWKQDATGMYDQIYAKNGNSVYISSWGNMGYSYKSYSLETLYQELKKGPVIIHRSGSGGHYSVVVGYEGSSSTLQSSGFRVMEVQRYNRTDGSYGYPTSWGDASKVNMDTWATYAKGGIDQIVARNALTDTQSPVVTSAYISQYDKDGYTVVATATDNMGVASMRFPTRRADQSDNDWQWKEGNRNSDGSFSIRVNVSDFGNREGTYYTDVYAYDTGGNYTGAGRLSVYIDRSEPVISNVKVSNLTPSGYTVTCTVTDNTGINRVQFPTWTLTGGQDDVALNWPTNQSVSGSSSGSQYTYQVKDSDHNYERGVYATHIYAYDNYGNVGTASISSIKVENNYKAVKKASYGNYEYSLFNDVLSWEEARKKCKELGGDLVSITSAGEENAVKQLLVGASRPGYHIGGKKVSGKWTWVDGSRFSYTNWTPGEPDNYNGNEIYVEMLPSGFWIDNNVTHGNGRGFILKKMKAGWQKINGSWYYVASDGTKKTGWQKVDNKWYYLNNKGVMQVGWQNISGKWYYLDGSGVMQIGWCKVSGKWYYLDQSGVMRTDWQKISGKWYYLDGSGVMKTGWQKISGKWYYMSSDGVMKTGWQKVSGKWYYLDGSGAMQTGWQKISGNWYYLQEDGSMVTTSREINGKMYYFRIDGVWIQ